MDQAHITFAKTIAGIHEDQLNVWSLGGGLDRSIVVTQGTRRRSQSIKPNKERIKHTIFF